MKLQNHLPVFIFFIVLFISCNSSSDNQPGNDSIKKMTLNGKAGINEATQALNTLTILENLLGPKSDDFNAFNNEGHEVRLDSARQCILLFKPTMKDHLIMDTITSFIMRARRARKITESERFGGAGLLAWLMKTVDLLDSLDKGKNLTIRLSLGIYTNEFLNTYLPKDSILRAKKQDRITIFVIPEYTGKKANLFIKGEEATAYELGGLEP